MKRFLILISLILGCCKITFAQLETAIWYFGRNAGLDFNTPIPKILLDGALNNLEGVATFSDSQGNLLFYTDGRTVWNRKHNVMQNGDKLVGHCSSTESSIIMPWPNNPYKYFIFVVDSEFGDKGLSYSIVDMRLDDGLGGVTSEKNIPLEDVVCEKVTAIRHENGRDFWLITRLVPGNKIVEYLVNESGIVMETRKEFPVCFFPIKPENAIMDANTGELYYDYDPTMAIGYMRIAPNGKKIAVANASASLRLESTGEYINILDVLDFDPATGKINPYLTYFDKEAFLYGVEFSNDVSKLYFTSRRKIFQMDLSLPNSNDVLNSVIQVGEYPQLTSIDTSYAGALQLALNGKIYVAQRDYEYLGVIDNPRSKGTDCNYIVDGQYLGGKISLMGLPNFIPTYFLPPNFQILTNCTNDVTKFICTDTREIDSYEWILATVADQEIVKSNEPEFSYKLSEPGKYKITMTISVMGVEHSDYRIFEVYEPPFLRLHNDTIICEGGVCELDGVVNDTCTFVWKGFDVNENHISIREESKIVGILTDKNTGCISQDTVDVKVAKPILFTLGPDLEYCVGKSVEIKPEFDMNNYREWQWIDSNDKSPERVFSQPGKYVAKALDINYCVVADTVEVIENPLPKIVFGDDEILCSNISRTLDCGVENAKYYWNNGQSSKTIVPTVPGKYSVRVIDNKGCESEDSVVLVGKILPDFNLPADTVMCEGNTLTLNAFWPDAVNYVWQDMSNNSEFLVEGPGNYSVTVSNVCGAVDDEIFVRYRFCGEFVFPNIITPNGDDINDFFKIKGLDEFTNGWNIDIYNREGKHVYHSDDYKNEWNASGLSDGVYFYIFYRGDDFYKGNITVFRR